MIRQKLNISQANWVNHTFAQMTQDQKIGQLVCERDRLLAEEPGLKWRYRYPVSLAGLHSFAHRYNASDLKSWMRHYPVGSIFVGTEIIQADSDDTVKMRAGMRKFNEVSRTPLLFCGDFEHGVGAKISGLTRLPDLMALGAANDVKLAREYGAMIAREGLSVGAQWSFSPVVDLNRNMNSWVVNQRAIGDDPARATPLLKALVQGMQAGGMAACAKHFPGDGTDDRNQHMVTSLQMLPFREWLQMHGKVFQAMIDAGVLSIMIGHIAFPALEGPDSKTGRYRPATASRKIMTDLLRRRMGFDGVIVTDALTMCGFCSWAPYEQRILECFNGGADVFLWPDTPRFFKLLKQALKDGRASRRRLDESVVRILTLKALLGLHEEQSAAPVPLKLGDKKQNQAFSRRVAERSLTLLRNRGKLLPLKQRRGAQALALVAENLPSDLKRFKIFCAELQKRGCRVTLAPAAEFKNWRERLGKFDLLFLLGNIGTINSGGSATLVRESCGIIWPLLARGESKLIGISFGNPYMLREVASINTYINTYSNCQESQRAVVAALFGEIPFRGRSPVSCPFVFCAGEGIK